MKHRRTKQNVANDYDMDGRVMDACAELNGVITFVRSCVCIHTQRPRTRISSKHPFEPYFTEPVDGVAGLRARVVFVNNLRDWLVGRPNDTHDRLLWIERHVEKHTSK